jgi:predicted metal-dependent HD superfamily phosphohydrolase
MQINASLLLQWQKNLEIFKIEPLIIRSSFDRTIVHYTDPARYYHNLQHIQEVLKTIALIEDIPLNIVRLAAWFHDIIYKPQAKDNEEKSAIYAREMLTELGLPEQAIATICRLILCTKNHQAEPEDLEAQILLDADLAILGSNRDRYQKYTLAIAQEYSWLPALEYRQGRQKVLENFLARDRLYFTKTIFTLKEKQARNNLIWEIKQLSQ